MAHLYVISRGVKKEVDDFFNQLQGKYLPFKYKDPIDPTKLSDQLLQVGVRPIQLWEIVYPVECQDAVINSIVGAEGRKNTQHSKHEKYLSAFRFALGAKKLPPYKPAQILPLGPKIGMEIAAIGVKPDDWEDVVTGERFKEKRENCFEAI